MGGSQTFSRVLFVILSFLLVLIITLVIISLNVSILTKFTSFFQPYPGSCLILEEKYCKRKKVISDPAGLGYQLVIFKVPSGATLFSPQEGDFSSTAVFTKIVNGKEFKYPAVNIISPRGNVGKMNKSFSKK